MRQLLKIIDLIPKSWTWILGLIFLIGLSILDFVTGYELAFSFFYLVPVSLIAWRCGIKAGLVISGLCSILWSFSNHLAGERFSALFVTVWNAGTRLGFFVVVTLLLAEVHTLLRHERTLARTDTLTGALNRRGFYQVVQMELSRCIRHRRPFALLYMDLDNFKAVNDKQGHDAGDEVLISVMRCLYENLRKYDQVARLGGDEFAILFPEIRAQQAQTFIPRLQQP